MKKVFLFLVMLSAIKSFSQNCNCFNILPNPVGCAPFDISIQDCSGGVVDYVYEPNTPSTTVTTHQYLNPGSFSITQSGNFTCGGIVGIKKLSKPLLVKAIPSPNLSAFSCANNKVLIKATDPQYDEYFITNSNNQIDTIQKGYSKVIQVGPPPIQVQGNYLGANCGGKSSLNLKGTVTLPSVKISKISLNADYSIDIEYNGIDSEMYQVQIKDNQSGNYKIQDTILSGSSSYKLTGLDNNSQYCIKFRSVDFCGQTGSFSNEICTVSLVGKAIAEKNNISWSSNSTISDYSLKINNVDDPNFNQRSQTLSYSDTNIICGTNYCYNINALTVDNATSVSNTICLTAISKKKPSPISGFSSDIQNNNAVLQWNPPLSIVKSYSVFYSADKAQYGILSETISNPFTDQANNSSSNQFCYKISLADNCGNSSNLSAATCPTFLNGTIVDATTRRLTWKPYEDGIELVKEYLVEKIDQNGTVYFSISVSNTFDFTDKGLDTLEQIINYRIKAILISGKETYSNIWKAVQKGNFYMPNAFTPNGDGLNDTYHAEGLFITKFQIEIWNRNGEGVFSSNSFHQGWDGKINGLNAPVDTYMYKVEATDKLGAIYKRNGSLQLLK